MIDKIKALVVSELKEVKMEVGEIKTEMKNMANKVQIMEDKVQKLEGEVKDLKEEEKRVELRWEIKPRELELRIRGLDEEKGENIRDRIVNLISKLTEQEADKVDKALDQVFGSKSLYAEQRKIPRDVLVNVLTKKMKEEILNQSIWNPIKVKGRKVFIMKELQRQVLAGRKTFRKSWIDLRK